MRPKAGVIGWTLLVISLNLTPSYALDLPPAEEPSVIEKKVRKEAEEILRRRVEVPKPEEELEEEPRLEGRFFLRKIVLEGNTQIPSLELEPLVRPFENREQSMAELRNLTKAINWEYRRQGFITSLAVIPPQKIDEGRLIVQIIEGKVGKIRVEGNRYFRTKRVLSYARINKGEILRYEKLRGTLYRLNQNPDRAVRSILKSGEEPRTTDIVLKVEDRFPVHLGGFYDNQGSESSGQQRFGFNLRDSNLVGLDDILSTGTVFGRHFGVFFSRYTLPFPSTDTTWSAGFSHAQVSPKRDLEEFSVNGTTETYFTRIQQVLLQGSAGSMAYVIGCQLGMEFKEERTKVLASTFRRERFRVIRFGPTLRLEDPWGVTDLGQEFSFGVKGLGAAVHADLSSSRQGVEPDFFLMSGNLFRNQKLPFDTRATLRIDCQFPKEKLSSSEALYMGGAGTIRGYPEGDYLADAGYTLSLEYLAPSFFFPADWRLPYSKVPLRRQVELVVFLDSGYGRLRGPSEREVRSRHLAGVGGGLRVKLYRELYGRAEWAHAFGDHPLTESNRHEFHFRIQWEI